MAETPLFDLWITNLRRRVLQENHDAVVAITGYEGSGKSTLALKIAHCLNPNFKAEHVAFDINSTLRVLKNAPRGSVIDYDEAADGAFAREAMSTENKSLVVCAMVSRARNLFWLLCIPNLHNLDPYFREHRIKNWWHVTRRGEATLHVAKRNPYRPGTWWKAVLRYQYGPVDGDLWETYDAAKQAHMRRKVESEWRKVEKKTGRRTPTTKHK